MALLSACTATAVEVRDDDVLQLDGRLQYRVVDGGSGAPWYALELDVARAGGDATQELGAGEALSFGGQSFFGPARVALDYELRRAIFGLVVGADVDAFRVSTELGLAWQELTLELATGGQRAADEDAWAGPLAGVEVLWAPARWCGLDARASWATSLEAELRELELGAVLGPRAPLALFAGWRWLDAYHGRDSESDLDLDLDGPVLGLRGSL